MAMRTVGDSEIEEYFPLVETQARQLQRYAEYDDLFQEGLISVWEQLSVGEEVRSEQVRVKMRAWIRQEKKHTR